MPCGIAARVALLSPQSDGLLADLALAPSWWFRILPSTALVLGNGAFQNHLWPFF